MHHRVSGSTEGALFLAGSSPASVHSYKGQTATGDITVLAGKRLHIQARLLGPEYIAPPALVSCQSDPPHARHHDATAQVRPGKEVILH